MIRPLLSRLLREEDGATLVEFALITPPLLVTIMGVCDLAYNMYTNEMLQGAIQNAARFSTIEGAADNPDAQDAMVTRAVKAVSPYATLQFERKSYTNFTDVNRPEDYTDVDKDGTCNNGEPFEDANGNGSWDQNPGQTGFGGARDAVLYTVTVEYPRAFPIAAFIPGQTTNFTLRSASVLRNQPYGASNNTAPPVGSCT
jgi:Flp pilus assembly protein TadG